MGEPISLALLGGAVLTEGVRFLFDQASQLIRAARERKHAKDSTPTIHVEVDSAVLDGAVESTVDARLLDEQNKRLIALTGAIAPYANGDAEIEPDDGELIASAADLRALLEALYGQRITLRGENREPSGTRVDVRQALGAVRGTAVGVEADEVRDATIAVTQEATSVEPGGSVTGVRLGKIGPE